jgi:hypothetical protein
MGLKRKFKWTHYLRNSSDATGILFTQNREPFVFLFFPLVAPSPIRLTRSHLYLLNWFGMVR